MFNFVFTLLCSFLFLSKSFGVVDPNFPLKLRPGIPQPITALNATTFELSGYCAAGTGDVSITFGTLVFTTPCLTVLGAYHFVGDVTAEVTTNPILHCATQGVVPEECADGPVTNEQAPAGMYFDLVKLNKIVPGNEASYKAKGQCAPIGGSILVDVGASADVLSGTCGAYNKFEVVGDASAVADGIDFLVQGKIDGVVSGTSLVDKGVAVSILVSADITPANENVYSASGACSDDGELVLLSIGGVPFLPSPTCSGNAWAVAGVDASALPQGNVIIIANHMDSLGNSATPASVTVTKDTVAPVVTINTLDVIDILNQGAYDFSGTCDEESADVSVSIGGVTPLVLPTCTSSVWSVAGLDLTSVIEGSVAVSASQTDAFANTGSTSATVLKEIIPFMFWASSTATVGSSNINLGADDLLWTGVLVSPVYFEIDAVNTNIIKIKVAGDYRLSFTLDLGAVIARSNILAEVKLNGSVVQGGVSASSYIRNIAGHQEASDHIDLVLNGLSVDDEIEIEVSREANAGTVTALAHLFLEPIVTDKIFMATATEVVSGTNLNVNGGDSLEWSSEIVGSDFSHSDVTSPEEVTFDTAGNYFVSTNVPYFSTLARTSVGSRLVLDGAIVPGSQARQSYIRASNGHNSASAHWQGVLEGVTSGQVLEIETFQDARAGTGVNLPGQASSLSIEKMENTDFISLQGVGVLLGANWNQTSTVSWVTQNSINASIFAHSTVIDPNEIEILEDGEYFISYTDSLTSTAQRPNVAIKVLLDGVATGLNCHSHYIRSNSGHNNSSCSLSGLLPNLVSGNVITIETSREGNAGTVTSIEPARLFIWKKY